METIDRVPIKSLPSRYNIARSLLYTRLKDLNIKPEKDSKQAYISSEQLAHLDALNDHIKQGRTTSTFLTKRGMIASFDPASGLPPSNNISTFTQLVHEIASVLRPASSPLQHLECLERAFSQQWLLSTSEVKQLLGVKPLGEVCVRGSFAFIKKGKIGRETAWRVEKA